MAFHELTNRMDRVSIDLMGRPIIYQASGGTPVQIDAIVDDTTEADEGIVTPIPHRGMTVMVNRSDIAPVRENADRFEIDGVSYTPIETVSDDFDVVEIRLRKI